MSIRGEIPVLPDPEAARSAAQRELAEPGYQAHEPTLFQRIANAVLDRLGEVFDATAGAAPGGRWSLALLVLLAVLLALVVRARLGRLATGGPRPGEVFSAADRSSAEHHGAADAALAAGDLAEAVQERFRALVRGLEERGLLDPRPGRTANEAAAEAGAVLSPAAAALRAAAGVFDEVRYGGRPATRAGHDAIAVADAAVRQARVQVQVRS